MRLSVRQLAVALVLVPSALAAQAWHFSVAPFVGRTMSSPIAEPVARVVYPSPGGGGQWTTYTNVRRLELRDATVAGARVERRFGRAWTAFAEGAYGRTELDWLEITSIVGSGPESLSSSEMRRTTRDASTATLSLGAGRQFTLWRPELELGLGAAASVQRFDLDRWPGMNCPTADSTQCEADPWDETYVAPGGAGSLSLRWALRPSLGLEARSLLTAVRAAVGDLRNCPAILDLGGASASCSGSRSWVRAAQLSLGLSVRR